MNELEEYKRNGYAVVYSDESGHAHDMPRTHGYSPIDQRCYGLHNFGAKGRTNVIGALYEGKLLTTSLFECNVDSDIFETWLNQDLLDKLPPKSVLVIDNASFHKKDNIEAILDKRGHKLLFLSPYSPEYNPIEKKWAQAKSIRRTLQCSINDLYKHYIT